MVFMPYLMCLLCCVSVESPYPQRRQTIPIAPPNTKKSKEQTGRPIGCLWMHKRRVTVKRRNQPQQKGRTRTHTPSVRHRCWPTDQSAYIFMALPRVEVPKCARPAEIRVDVGWLPRDEIGVPPCATGTAGIMYVVVGTVDLVGGLKRRPEGRFDRGGGWHAGGRVLNDRSINRFRSTCTFMHLCVQQNAHVYS